ncbi:MAG: hypothetical protein WDW38_003349 [Sanguina aurantia]
MFVNVIIPRYEELEKRLEKLRVAKGATPYGQGTKALAKKAANTPVPTTDEAGKALGALMPMPAPLPKAGAKVYDYSDETLHYEGPPHRGDLAVNIALGATLIWLPLTFAAFGRCLFVNYRFTNRRISVISNPPWGKSEQLDCAYQEVKEVRSLGRGIGAWGDMVVVLNDGSKIEMRSLSGFRELEKYILERRDELVGPLDDGDKDIPNEDGAIIKPGKKVEKSRGFA